MTKNDFIKYFRVWLKHKKKLATVSKYYQSPLMRARMQKVNEVFGEFIVNSLTFSSGHLAVQIQKHKDLLIQILPHPNNKSYLKSEMLIHKYISESETILKDINYAI